MDQPGENENAASVGGVTRFFLRLLEEGAPFFSLKLCYEGDRLTYAALNGKELTQ